MSVATGADSCGEYVGDVVDEGNNDDGDEDDEGFAAGDQPGRSEGVAYGDVALHGHGDRDPYVALLQRHHDVVSRCVDNWVDDVQEVISAV